MPNDSRLARVRAHSKVPSIVYESKLMQAVADLLRDALCMFDRAMFENDRELIAAEPGERVPDPNGFAEQLGGLLQHLVAHRMPARVIDELELIQVDVHQRMAGLLGTHLLQ